MESELRRTLFGGGLFGFHFFFSRHAETCPQNRAMCILPPRFRLRVSAQFIGRFCVYSWRTHYKSMSGANDHFQRQSCHETQPIHHFYHFADL